MTDFENSRPLAAARDVMSRYQRPWMLCGGWAVDAWLGRKTREHADVDICVFDNDQRTLREHLHGWHLIAHDRNFSGDATQEWDGRQLELPAHIHAGEPGEREAVLSWVTSPKAPRAGLSLDIVFNRRSGSDFISINPDISLPLERSFRPALDGVPTMVPELLMFFKATAYAGLPGYPRDYDRVDFLALARLLGREERQWLRDNIPSTAGGSSWLASLDD